MSKSFTLLADLGERSNCAVLDGETQTVRQLSEYLVSARTALECRALPDALRGARYTVADGVITYDGRLPMTEEFVTECHEHFSAINTWNIDWPHIATECDPEAYVQAERVTARLLADLQSQTAAPAAIVAVVPRWLHYYTDGSLQSQQQFVTVAPKCSNASPFRLDGKLRPAYQHEYTPLMRDAKVPLPEDLRSGGVVPLLFRGRAFCVEFTLANCDPAIQNCRVYVDWEGNFICSDWCQRTSKTRYESQSGIDLQTGQYTFGSWILTSAVVRAESQSAACKTAMAPFKGKRFSMGKLLASAPPPVPSLATALERVAARQAASRSTPLGELTATREAFVTLVRSVVDAVPTAWSDDDITEQLAGTASVSLLLGAPLTRQELAQLTPGFPVRVVQRDTPDPVSAAVLRTGTSTRYVTDVTGELVTLSGVQRIYIDRDTLRELVRSARLQREATVDPTPAPLTPEIMQSVEAAVQAYYAQRRFARTVSRVQSALVAMTPNAGPITATIGALDFAFTPMENDQVAIEFLDEMLTDLKLYGWMDGATLFHSLAPRGEGTPVEGDVQSVGYLVWYYFNELVGASA